uniref:RT06283p n=1 Tax=Drosophila melanogaster TaxID=7227 RepID=D8FT39_DROME|nr:RT06283p [Drosophila melanogaster]
MKCKIPEISWHNRDPVLSVDIQQNGLGLRSPTICRLASGGSDAHVLIWYVNRSDDAEGVDVELAADLSRHQRAVNAVRWSPNGELLASGDDESVVFIWKQKADHEVVNIVDADGCSEQDKEVWLTLKVLRGHREDIYDLSWAPNSQFLVSGSVDNTAMLWDVHSGKSLAILDDHKGYVQGVAWDPCNQYIATMSTDRQMRIFDANTKRVLHRVSKCVPPVKEDHEMHGKSMRLYQDGTLQTFFRRLCFTPDGKLLLTPSGITDYDGVVKPINTSYGFSRHDLSKPAFVLPFPKEYAVAVRCSPVLYRLRPYNAEKNPPIISLPYRMIYAVATKNAVFFYDTQQPVPFAIVSNIHYSRLTDLAWSSDGTVLIVSSTDGYCSLITFEPTELGDCYEDMETVLSVVLKSSENATVLKKKRQKLRKASLDEPRKPLQEKSKPNTIRRASEAGITEVGEPELDAENDSSTHSVSSNKTNSPKTKASEEEKPTPIAIRRSPRKNSTAPMPIAIRRAPRKPEDKGNSESSKPKDEMEVTHTKTTQVQKTVASPVKRKVSTEAVPPAETSQPALAVIPVFEKEIISSDDKFESPEKKSRPATPIQVRRQPRTPGSSSQFNLTPKSQPAKQATPIAVRRTPRVLIEMPVNSPVVPMEEAMDAWPLDESITPLPATKKDSRKPLPETVKTETKPAVIEASEATCERTEDIRLVYEDTQEETPKNPTESGPSTPNNKTPRRVSLRTISTPKSKKKLLE